MNKKQYNLLFNLVVSFVATGFITAVYWFTIVNLTGNRPPNWMMTFFCYIIMFICLKKFKAKWFPY